MCRATIRSLAAATPNRRSDQCGHRNIQAATLDSQGQLWTIEHGPRGGDELNHPQKGLNYGWPVITYGIE